MNRIRAIAEEKGVTAAQLALAWVLSGGEDIVPIPGTTKPRRVEENVAALALRLADDDLRRLDEAAPMGTTAGDRYPPAMMSHLDG